MFGSQVLDVAIGLTLIFCLLSLVVSALREMIEGWLKTKAVHLQRGIQQMLTDPANNDLTAKLYEHPVIASLYQDDYRNVASNWFNGKKMPSYIPSAAFAGALMDLVLTDSNAPTDKVGNPFPLNVSSLRAAAEANTNTAVKRAVIVAIDGARGDIAKAQANIEAWFDASMARVSGWYRRHTQIWLLLLALTFSILGNINTIAIANHIWRSKAAQDLLVQTAAALVKDSTLRAAAAPQATGTATLGATGATVPVATARTADTATTPATTKTDAAKHSTPPRPDTVATLAYAKFESLNLPVGWPRKDMDYENPWATALGLLLTAIALTLGAPFWFDLLSKMMQVRASVKPKDAAT